MEKKLSYEKWEKEFVPYIDEDWQLRTFHWDGSEKTELDEILDSLAREHGIDRFKFVWTIQTDDNGVMCITNGFHFVNRMEYVVTEKPWEEGDIYYVCYEEDCDESA